MSSALNDMLTLIESVVLRDYTSNITLSKKYLEDTIVLDKNISEISSSATSLKESISQTNLALDEMALAISESATGIQDIAKKTEEILESSIESSKAIDNTDGFIKQLKESVDEFKI